MISISTTHPVSWPSPVSTAVNPVTSVDAVRPIDDGKRSGQSGTRHGAENPAPAQTRRDKAQASGDMDHPPLLPRKPAADADPASQSGTERTGAGDALARREAQQARAEAEAEKAAEFTRKQQLQAVLSDVWKASAAVVDRVLGRTTEPAQVSAPPTDASMSALKPNSGQVTAIEPLLWPVMPEGGVVANAAGVGAEAHPVQEVVAYDERGNSSLAPLEAGVFIDRKV